MIPEESPEDERPSLAPIRVVGAAIIRAGRCFAARRGPQQRDGGKWEFPGGKVEAGESGEQALARELREELEIDVEVGAFLGASELSQPRALRLELYRASLRGGEPRCSEHDASTWCDSDALRALDWAAADIPLVELVCGLLMAND